MTDMDLGDAMEYVQPSVSTDVGDLVWETVEQLHDLAISALDDWLAEWGDRESGLPYAAKIEELKEALEGLTQQLRDVAKDIDNDLDAEANMPIDDYSGANEEVLRSLGDRDSHSMPSADDLLADTGPAFKPGPISLEDLFGPSDRDKRQAELTDLFAGGVVTNDSISLEGTETTDDE